MTDIIAGTWTELSRIAFDTMGTRSSCTRMTAALGGRLRISVASMLYFTSVGMAGPIGDEDACVTSGDCVGDDVHGICVDGRLVRKYPSGCISPLAPECGV